MILTMTLARIIAVKNITFHGELFLKGDIF
jgi:hypothetical protein